MIQFQKNNRTPEPYVEQIKRALDMIQEAQIVLVGAGAGISTAAGLTYSGRRFTDNFSDFIEKYGMLYMKDMYSGR